MSLLGVRHAGPALRTRVRHSHILDAHGAPVPMAYVYEAAQGGRRFRGMDAPNVGPNGGEWDVGRMRQRVRALDRNDPRVRKALNTLTAELIGTGIKPQSALPDRTQRKAIHQLWFDWVDEADADGQREFYGLQALAFRTMVRDGECFLRLRPRLPKDGLSVPLQVQLLEADMCPLDHNGQGIDGNVIRAGIEFDRLGRRVAYWMLRQHPGDPNAGTSVDPRPVRIAAEDIVHVYLAERPGQIRGVTWFSPVILRAHNMDLYDDAQMWRQNLATAFVGVWEQQADPSDLDVLDDDGTTATAPTLEHGTIIRGEPGETFKTTTPPGMGDDYDAFKTWQTRDFGAGLGLDYSQLSGDRKGSSYSAERTGTLQFRRFAEPLIHQVAFTLCRPVWHRWMDLAAAASALPLPQYALRRREYQRVRWVPQGWPWVDPQKDGAARIMHIAAGLASPQETIAELGNDPEQVLDDMVAWKQMLAERGLTPADFVAFSGGATQAAPAPAGGPGDDPVDEDAADDRRAA